MGPSVLSYNNAITLTSSISVACHLELHVAITYYRAYHFYQACYFMFFDVHTNRLSYLSTKLAISKKRKKEGV